MANQRFTIVMNVDIFSSNSFLFGRDVFVSDVNKTLYIDAVVPVSDKNDASPMSKRILGMVVQGHQVCDFAAVLKHFFTTSSFYAMPILLPIQGSFEKCVLVFPSHSGRHDDMFCNQVLIVYSRRNIKLSSLNFPCLHNLNKGKTEEEPMLSRPIFQPPEEGSTRWLKAFTPVEYFLHSIEYIRRNLPELLSLTLVSILWLIQWITGLSSVLNPKYCLAYSSNYCFVAKQLLYRLNQICEIVLDKKDDSEKANLETSSTNTGNQALSIIIDILLGLMVVYYAFSNWNFSSISTWIIGQKYTVAGQLQNLLKWLMGVPAGLKLNKPLDEFLGNFYLYHVHLWTSYLYFIEAYLPKLIWICTLSGCLGITFLLSILCDVLSLLTLHIYCFYIYAARLYNIEIHALASLLRLFTGKKWNILRGRVDSIDYDVDRLFIGTLLFTILLFLLPTIFLYYIVFTSLRLLVILMQAVLFGFVALFNSFPFWGLCLYFLNSEHLPGIIIADVNVMKTLDGDAGFPDFYNAEGIRFLQPDLVLFVSFRHKCFPLGTLFETCIAAVVKATYYGIIGEGVFKQFLTGKLIVSSNKV